MGEILEYGDRCPKCGYFGLNKAYNVDDACHDIKCMGCGRKGQMHPADYAPDKPEEPKTWASDGDGSSYTLWKRLRDGEHDACEEGVKWWGHRPDAAPLSIRQAIAIMFDEAKFHWACWLVVKYGNGNERDWAQDRVKASTGCGLRSWADLGLGMTTASHKDEWDTPEIRAAFYAFAERLGADLKAGRLGEYPPDKQGVETKEESPRDWFGRDIDLSPAMTPRGRPLLAIKLDVERQSGIEVTEPTWREMVRRGNARFGIDEKPEPPEPDADGWVRIGSNDNFIHLRRSPTGNVWVMTELDGEESPNVCLYPHQWEQVRNFGRTGE